MFHSRIINNKINCLHERCLCLLYWDKSLSFEKLLEQDKSVTVHTRNLPILATEMFKVYRNISLPIFSKIFHRRDRNYNLRINSDSAMPNARSVFHGSGSISYLGRKRLHCGFSKNVFFREGMKRCFFVTFNIITSQVYPENFTEIPPFFQKI